MKAIIHSAYGPPDELQLKDIDKPVPKSNEVLIKINATTVTSSDCNIRNLTFVPALVRLPIRLQFGFSKPKTKILGLDLAGEIEAVGDSVKNFGQGDQVFGTPDPDMGTYAEYICVPEDVALTKKPADLSWEEAAAIPNMGNSALFFLRDLAKLQARQSILIIGASGGIGTFAVQLAKHYGAHVTGVCSGANVGMVKSLGADRVIDYKKEDFAQGGESYDVIFDVVDKSSFSRCKSLLKPKGIFLATLPTFATLFSMLWTSIFGGKKVKFGGAVAKVENLVFLRELVEAGAIKPVIGRSYPLEQMAKAFHYVEQGHKKGNVVITVGHAGQSA